MCCPWRPFVQSAQRDKHVKLAHSADSLVLAAAQLANTSDHGRTYSTEAAAAAPTTARLEAVWHLQGGCCNLKSSCWNGGVGTISAPSPVWLGRNLRGYLFRPGNTGIIFRKSENGS